jgi:group I intron endonuclease
MGTLDLFGDGGNANKKRGAMNILALDIATKTGWKTETTSKVREPKGSHVTTSGVYVLGIDESKKAPDGKYYYVYCVVNLLTNRLYIGKRTTTNLLESYTGSGTAIKCAVEKHGKHNFGRHILEYTDTPEKLRELELYYIKDVFNADKNPACYNLVVDSGRPMNGRPVSESTKELLRKHNLGKRISEETKRKISIANKGRKDSDETRRIKSQIAMGRIISSEQRGQIRKTLKKKWKDPVFRDMMNDTNTKNRRPVYQYAKDGTFIKEHAYANKAKRELGADVYGFFNKGHRYTAGCIWSYIKKVNILDYYVYDEKNKGYVEI